MLTKQAKIVSKSQLTRLLDYVSHSRYPERDRVIVLLSFKAGLRAKEIAGLTWSMITDANGDLTDVISLQNQASKGKRGGRVIPIHPELSKALAALKAVAGERCRPHLPIVYSERGKGYSANGIAVWFHTRYHELGIQGASSH